MPKFDTPENAFDSLFTAYKASDLDAMMFAKNFELDSRLFWQDLGLPVSTEQKEKSTSAFETNFRNQMIDEGIPDYSDATYTIKNIEERGEDTVVLSVNLRWPSGETADLSIPAVFHDNQWWVALAPGFDHL